MNIKIVPSRNELLVRMEEKCNMESTSCHGMANSFRNDQQQPQKSYVLINFDREQTISRLRLNWNLSLWPMPKMCELWARRNFITDAHINDFPKSIIHFK